MKNLLKKRQKIKYRGPLEKWICNTAFGGRVKLKNRKKNENKNNVRKKRKEKKYVDLESIRD